MNPTSYVAEESVVFSSLTNVPGWACSNGRRYDDGMLVFDLAKPGETVTMTAIWARIPND